MALLLAMLTDSLVDHPYGKLQLLLAGLVAVRAGNGQERAPTETDPNLELRGGLGSRALAVALALTAAGAVVSSAALVQKSFLTATVKDLYLEVIEATQSRSAPLRLEARERELLERAARAGERAARLPGYTKESCDDLLVLAHTEILLGRRRKALSYARDSLRVHPYNPSALDLMATLLAHRSARSARWRRAHEHVLNEATHGFEGPYPEEPGRSRRAPP
jgi:hypothetical protein